MSNCAAALAVADVYDALISRSVYKARTASGGKIEAAPLGTRVTVTAHASDPVLIEVENRGVVAPEIRERFFERGVSFGKEGGSGIGTYSARLLINAQDGSVSMRTDDASGRTVLTVGLPKT